MRDRPVQRLIGRAQELLILESFIRESIVDGGALLLSGDPGVGKTALLDAAAGYARDAGAVVLRIEGTEQERQLSYAALNQALYPLAGRFEDLGKDQRMALEVALGFCDGPPPNRLLVSNAVAVLLRTTAERSPHVLLVDDVQWIDRASAGVFSFVARRLAGSRAGMLAAGRSGEDQGYFDRAGLPAHELKPLTEEAADRLVSEHFAGIDAIVKDRILRTANGNPLALLELPRSLTDSQRSAAERLPAVLPLGERLNRSFASRVLILQEATRRLLLAAALEGTGDLGVLEAAGFDADDVAPAERDRLVEVHDHRLRFRHPLIRSAVVEAATASERRATHARLAAVLLDQPERRAWHLGEATVVPDEQVAIALEEAAQHILARGDHQATVALLIRSADLSPEAAERSRRLATAAFIGAEAMGETRSVAELLADSRRASSSAQASLHYASASALVMLDDDGHLGTIHHLLARAIEGNPQRHDAGDPEIVNALWTLALLSFLGGREELWTELYDALDRLTEGPPALLRLVVDLFADPVRTGLAALPRLEAELLAVRHDTDTEKVQNLAGAAMYVDRLAQARDGLWRHVVQGREGGPARRQLVALMDLCVDDFHRGQWQEAAELAEEGLQLTEHRAGRFFAFYFRYHQALLAAVRGRVEESRELAEQMIGWAGPRDVGVARTYAQHALILAALADADFESAYRHACAMSPAGTLASHVPHCLWVAMDLVEAAVRTDRRVDAERHVRALREAKVSELSPRLAILVAASAGLVAAGDEARTYFEQALASPGAEQWPFDVARVRLLYGEHLRRARAIAEAKVQLQEALAAFRTLGAAPWAARAERELRAAGLAAVPVSRAASVLTAQELQIARLAASGLTNKEIAARLYLSPRTVSGHLYRIFPKLGITTRAAIRDALGP